MSCFSDRNAPVIIRPGAIPDPIRLVSGGKLPIKGSLVVRKDFSAARLKVSVKVQKKILWGYVSLPCVSNVGSWSVLSLIFIIAQLEMLPFWIHVYLKGHCPNS